MLQFSDKFNIFSLVFINLYWLSCEITRIISKMKKFIYWKNIFLSWFSQLCFFNWIAKTIHYFNKQTINILGI